MGPMFSTRFDTFAENLIQNHIVPLGGVNNNNASIRQVLLKGDTYSIPVLSTRTPEPYMIGEEGHIGIKFKGFDQWFKAKPQTGIFPQYIAIVEGNEINIQFLARPDKLLEKAGIVMAEVFSAIKELEQNLNDYLDEHYPLPS